MYQVFSRAGILTRVIRQFNYQKGIFHLLYIGNLYPLTIYVSATAFPTIETLIPARIVHHTQQKFLPGAKGYTYTVRCIVVDIIRSTVQRVHNPAIGFILIHSRTFFRNKTGFGQQEGKSGNNLLLRFLVYIRNIVMRMFLFHALATECFSFFFQEISCIHSDAANLLSK